MLGIKLVDNRVDKICKKNGIVEGEIFYSPISYWFVLMSLFFTLSGLSVFVLFYLFSLNKFLILIPIIIYLFISFVLFSKLSNSFVITDDKFIIINPNFPFKKLVIYNKCEIIKITIDSTNKTILNFFLISDQNYLKIESTNNTKIYYCVGLEILSYEEIWTEKSLDCLYHALLSEGINVEFNFS